MSAPIRPAHIYRVAVVSDFRRVKTTEGFVFFCSISSYVNRFRESLIQNLLDGLCPIISLFIRMFLVKRATFVFKKEKVRTNIVEICICTIKGERNIPYHKVYYDGIDMIFDEYF